MEKKGSKKYHKEYSTEMLLEKSSNIFIDLVIVFVIVFVFSFVPTKSGSPNNFYSLFNNPGEVQNLEWSNVERPIFWNFKITNIEIAKDDLFDYFIYELFFIIIFLNYFNTQSIW